MTKKTQSLLSDTLVILALLVVPAWGAVFILFPADRHTKPKVTTTSPLYREDLTVLKGFER